MLWFYKFDKWKNVGMKFYQKEVAGRTDLSILAHSYPLSAATFVCLLFFIFNCLYPLFLCPASNILLLSLLLALLIVIELDSVTFDGTLWERGRGMQISKAKGMFGRGTAKYAKKNDLSGVWAEMHPSPYQE